MSKLNCVAVIPAYNEEGCIEEVLSAWTKELSSRTSGKYKIVVINDGSTDRTPQILDRLAKDDSKIEVIHQPNQGHGTALLNGYTYASGTPTEFIFQTDSDNQFSPDDFFKIWDQRSSNPILLGWRAKRNDPLHRIFIALCLRFGIRLMFGVTINDPNTPFRLMNVEFLKKVLPRLPKTKVIPNICMSILGTLEFGPIPHVIVQHRMRSSGQVSIIKARLLKFCWLALLELCWLKRVPFECYRNR